MLNVTSDVYNLLNMKKLDSMAHWGTGILFHDAVSNKFLLGIRKDNGLWGSPGGKVENGESPLNCAVRESIEECGLRPRKLYYLGANEDVDERGRQWNSFVFYCNDWEGELRSQDNEMNGWEWKDVPLPQVKDVSLPQVEEEHNYFEPTYRGLKLAYELGVPQALTEQTRLYIPSDSMAEDSRAEDGNGSDIFEASQQDKDGYISELDSGVASIPVFTAEDIPNRNSLYLHGREDCACCSYSEDEYTNNSVPIWD